MEFVTPIRYSQVGIHFPTVRIYSERHGDAQTTYTRISNLGKVHVVVAE